MISHKNTYCTAFTHCTLQYTNTITQHHTISYYISRHPILLHINTPTPPHPTPSHYPTPSNPHTLCHPIHPYTLSHPHTLSHPIPSYPYTLSHPIPHLGIKLHKSIRIITQRIEFFESVYLRSYSSLEEGSPRVALRCDAGRLIWKYRDLMIEKENRKKGGGERGRNWGSK